MILRIFVIIGFGTLLLSGVLILILVKDSAPHPVSLARICADGTQIWHYDNGRYGIPFHGGWIENPETICR